jgi:undecaprenyl diphosphate synthase
LLILEKIDLTDKKQTREDILRQTLLRQRGEIPKHIAIIMDGNGRWAKKHGKMRIHGHKAGVDSVRDTIESCAQLGVEYLTLYAFSTENWRRPKSEISALMKLLIQTLRKETQRLNDNDIRLNAIGEIDRLPGVCLKELREGMNLTEDNERMVVTLALSYSGRWDLNKAVKSLCNKVKSGELNVDDITDETISSHLATYNMPDPDLLIRTGGEFRISNFLLWQSAYTEFFITQRYWPEFRRDDIYTAIEEYQNRERRFGMISEQICNDKKENAGVSV